MAKLNQIIAIEKGIKSHAFSELSQLNKAVQKEDLFNGFERKYAPLADDGEKLPPESKRVQYTVEDVLRNLDRELSTLFEVTARKDYTNCIARSDVVVDGKTILDNVPVTYLLFLEKQLTDVRTFFNNLPVLDRSEDWKKDDASGLFKSGLVQTHRTKKTQKPIVLFPATDKHPAQTQLVTEDVISGFWESVKTSGAITKPDKDTLLKNVEKLLLAVKEAREAANNVDEAEAPDVGKAVFDFLLGA
jgi:hypothetical protein